MSSIEAEQGMHLSRMQRNRLDTLDSRMTMQNNTTDTNTTISNVQERKRRFLDRIALIGLGITVLELGALVTNSLTVDNNTATEILIYSSAAT